MSAAARVLGLPELLENIMLQLATDAIFISIDDDDHPIDSAVRVLQPIAALIPLYSVDRHFNAVITGSHKLQRAIFAQAGFLSESILLDRLKARDDLSGDELKAAKSALPFMPLNPLEWLLEEKLECRIAKGYRAAYNGTALRVDVRETRLSSCHTKYKKLMSSPFGAQGASWRRIRVFQSDVKKERLDTVVVSYHAPRRSGRIGWYHEALNLKDDTPLGAVFEKTVGIMLRTEAQHVAAERAYKSRKVA